VHLKTKSPQVINFS